MIKKALVTGSAGFAGRRFTHSLEERGFSVTCVDVADEEKSCDAINFFTVDASAWDLVVHCAAIVGGRAQIDGAPLDLAVNLQLDAALFDWARRVRPRRVVYVSSSAAYPVDLQRLEHGHDLTETDIDLEALYLGRPDALYGWAKLTGEVLAARARQEGLNVTVVRPFSGYGEEQSPAYPFRAFAERAKGREDPFHIWGNAIQCRDFIHISDVVEATLVMCEEGIDGPVNLGTGRAVSMAQLARMFTTAARYNPVLETVPGAPMGVGYRVADVTLMNDFYKPKVSLEEGIRRALDARLVKASVTS